MKWHCFGQETYSCASISTKNFSFLNKSHTSWKRGSEQSLNSYKSINSLKKVCFLSTGGCFRPKLDVSMETSVDRPTVTVLGSQISHFWKCQKAEIIRQKGGSKFASCCPGLSLHQQNLIHLVKFITAHVSIMTVLSCWLWQVGLHWEEYVCDGPPSSPLPSLSPRLRMTHDPACQSLQPIEGQNTWAFQSTRANQTLSSREQETLASDTCQSNLPRESVEKRKTQGLNLSANAGK